MKTIGSITYNLGLRQSTVRHFCNDFGIPFYDQFIGKPGMSNSILKDNFISYITDNVKFLLDYQQDYYSDKTPQIIADTIKRDINILEPFLKKEYPQYFNNGEFKKDTKLTFRYVSSYKIDFKLGGDYSFLNLDLNADLNKESEYLDLNIIGYQDVCNHPSKPILESSYFLAYLCGKK